MTKWMLCVWLLAGCESDRDRCDPDQRLSHGLCFAIGPDAGPDAGLDGGADGGATPPGSADTPAAPRSGS